MVQDSRKRKLPGSFHDERASQPLQMGAPEDSDSESEDDIHMFRRVHIKGKKARNGVRWSATYKHPLLVLQGQGLDVSSNDDKEWPGEVKRLAVYADKHFDHKFNYFEVQVLGAYKDESSECHGYVEKS